MIEHIPDKIGGANALFIAETDRVFDVVERDGRKIEIVLIAVCQYNPNEGYYLFGCDKCIISRTDYYYDELEDALEDAERIYNLEKIKWTDVRPK